MMGKEKKRRNIRNMENWKNGNMGNGLNKKGSHWEDKWGNNEKLGKL